MCSHIIDWVVVRPDDDIHIKCTVTDLLESDNYCIKSYLNISASKPSTIYRTVRNVANIDHPSSIAELSSVSEFSSIEKKNQYSDFLRTVPDKYAPPSLRKDRANIASEAVATTLVTGTTTAIFSSFEKVSRLTVKELISNYAPKSCELDPITFKLLIECIDSILPSITDLFYSSLVSGIFQKCLKSALVTPILKKRCLDHNYLNNYRPVSNLCIIAKILEKMSYPKFIPTSTHTISTILVNQHIVLITALKKLF